MRLVVVESTFDAKRGWDLGVKEYTMGLAKIL
jgi:hypothetical protein